MVANTKRKNIVKLVGNVRRFLSSCMPLSPAFCCQHGKPPPSLWKTHPSPSCRCPTRSAMLAEAVSAPEGTRERCSLSTSSLQSADQKNPRPRTVFNHTSTPSHVISLSAKAMPCICDRTHPFMWRSFDQSRPAHAFAEHHVPFGSPSVARIPPLS